MQTVWNFEIIRIFGCQNPLLISEYYERVNSALEFLDNWITVFQILSLVQPVGLKAKGAPRQDVCGGIYRNSGEYPRRLAEWDYHKICSWRISEYAANGTPSEKRQLPKLAWQQVRDDLCKGIMILPSSHSLKQWGRLHENHVGVKDPWRCEARRRSEILPFFSRGRGANTTGFTGKQRRNPL